jgi:hypothetical protein
MRLGDKNGKILGILYHRIFLCKEIDANGVPTNSGRRELCFGSNYIKYQKQYAQYDSSKNYFFISTIYIIKLGSSFSFLSLWWKYCYRRYAFQLTFTLLSYLSLISFV